MPAGRRSQSGSSARAAPRQPGLAALRPAASQRVKSAPATCRLKDEHALCRRAACARLGSSALTTAVVAAREDARLGVGVVLERRVAVHVIRRHVEHRRGLERSDAWSRAGTTTARARTGPSGGRVEQVERGLAEIAARRRRAHAGALGHAAERRHGALAVGAGDADDGRLGVAREQLDVADDGRAARARACTKNGSRAARPGEVTTMSAARAAVHRSRRCACPPARQRLQRRRAPAASRDVGHATAGDRARCR